MKIGSRPLAKKIMLASATALAVATFSTAASSAVVITSVGANFSTTPATINYGSSSFIFRGTGDIFNPTAVSTGGTGQFNTIFGQPTSYFVDRGTVTFGPNDQYAAFATPTTIRFSNGDNFIGLRAMIGDSVYYGFAYTTNNVLNSYGFENVAGRAVTATTAAGVAGVPEPASWALMIGGFGLVGGALRTRRPAKIVYA